MLAQHKLAGAGANRLRGNDLVRTAVLEHSVLVNSRFMRKCVSADYGLVPRHAHPGHFADHPAGLIDLSEI
ncbi:hypothetical protein D3C73_1211500 [compost metagenome]